MVDFCLHKKKKNQKKKYIYPLVLIIKRQALVFPWTQSVFEHLLSTSTLNWTSKMYNTKSQLTIHPFHFSPKYYECHLKSVMRILDLYLWHSRVCIQLKTIKLFDYYGQLEQWLRRITFKTLHSAFFSVEAMQQNIDSSLNDLFT